MPFRMNGCVLKLHIGRVTTSSFPVGTQHAHGYASLTNNAIYNSERRGSRDRNHQILPSSSHLLATSLWLLALFHITNHITTAQSGPFSFHQPTIAFDAKGNSESKSGRNFSRAIMGGWEVRSGIRVDFRRICRRTSPRKKSA